METVTCPYCERETEINNDEGSYYKEDARTETQCRHCEKNFMVSSSVSWFFEGQEAPCLNGGRHNWEQIVGVPREYFIGRFRCTFCDEEKKELSK